MTRTLTATVGALLLTACGDGQTGADYRGEPLMALRGVVSASESPLSQDLVPALSFAPRDSLGDDSFKIHFVSGEVEGAFPSSFTLRIYEPPAAELLEEPFLEGEPVFIVGHIVALEADHPSWVRRTVEYELDDDQNSYERVELCADSGECLTGYPGSCSDYDPNGQWPCGGRFPEAMPWTVYGYSPLYEVVYFASDVPEGSVLSKLYAAGASIPTGYYAVRYPQLDELSEDEANALAQCSQEARVQAIEATNAIYGTNATESDLSELSDADQQIEITRQELIALAELDCHARGDLFLDAMDDPIELPFADMPQSF